MAGGLSPETEELLRRARLDDERMPVAQRRHLKGAILARLAFASTATLAAGKAAASAMGLAAKAAVGLALVASVSTGGYLAMRAVRARAPRPTATRAVAGLAARPAPAAPAPAVAPPAPAAVETPPPVAPVARPRRVVVERERHGPGALARETSLLRDADRALRAGDPTRALAFLDRHARLFPDGVLAPERAAERLVVQCEVGAADGRAVATFLATHPGSPFASRVRAACADLR
jgi:hypothetical protein